jgi:hypothetical protein
VRRDPPRITLKRAEQRLRMAQAKELRAYGEVKKHRVKMQAQVKKMDAMTRRMRTLNDRFGAAYESARDAERVLAHVNLHGPMGPSDEVQHG